MTRACRQTCSGDTFDHEETIMSIARAGELLRCPICGREAEYTRSAPTHDRATPTPHDPRPPLRLAD